MKKLCLALVLIVLVATALAVQPQYAARADGLFPTTSPWIKISSPETAQVGSTIQVTLRAISLNGKTPYLYVTFYKEMVAQPPLLLQGKAIKLLLDKPGAAVAYAYLWKALRGNYPTLVFQVQVTQDLKTAYLISVQVGNRTVASSIIEIVK